MGIGGGGPDRLDTEFCHNAVGPDGRRDRRYQAFCQAGRSSLPCRGDPVDPLLGEPDGSQSHHQAGQRLAEMGRRGGSLPGASEGPGILITL